MTTEQLKKSITKVRKQIEKGNFKGNKESELHHDLNLLKKLLIQMDRIEQEFILLKTL